MHNDTYAEKAYNDGKRKTILACVIFASVIIAALVMSNNNMRNDLTRVQTELRTQKNSGITTMAISEANGTTCDMLTTDQKTEWLCPSCGGIAAEILKDFTITADNPCRHGSKNRKVTNTLHATVKTAKH